MVRIEVSFELQNHKRWRYYWTITWTSLLYGFQIT